MLVLRCRFGKKSTVKLKCLDAKIFANKCIGTKDAQSTIDTSTKDLTWRQMVSVNHRVVGVAERSEIRALDLQSVGPRFKSIVELTFNC